jgi:hypothetical protein
MLVYRLRHGRLNLFELMKTSPKWIPWTLGSNRCSVASHTLPSQKKEGLVTSRTTIFADESKHCMLLWSNKPLNPWARIYIIAAPHALSSLSLRYLHALSTHSWKMSFGVWTKHFACKDTFIAFMPSFASNDRSIW